MQTVGEMLRDVSVDLAREFDDVAVPAAFESSGSSVCAEGLELVRYELGSASTRLAVLAGPAAIRHVDGLRAFAAHVNAPVANTWGAKGVFPWDSPHHMGTCGLQARDFELLGFAEFDLVVATGIDRRESPRARYALTEVIEVAPKFLRTLPAYVHPRAFPIEPNALYERIAAVAQRGYIDESFPRHPARVVMDLKRSLDPNTIVCGQPGPAGLWLARTFPTDRPGTVCVPAVTRPGFAAVLALLASRNGRRAVAVTHAPIDEVTREVVELAPDLRIEVWGDDVDWTRTEELVGAAGPVVAWT